MKKIFFALILSVFFNLSASADESEAKYKEDCLKYISSPKVTLESSYGKLRYNYSKDMEYLGKATAEKLGALHKSTQTEFKIMGLTKVRDIFDYESTFGLFPLSKNYSCVYPESIKVRLAYNMPTIYIANNLQKDTCLYDLTMRHENTHMHIYIDALDYFLPIFKKYLEDQFNTIGIEIVSSQENTQEVIKKLNEKYLKGARQQVEAWRQEVEEEELKLDTPEHYLMESLICEHVDGTSIPDEIIWGLPNLN